ncbi:MAG: hypothetical protein A2204_07205 [Elusimicrobia bacterium RIFOXYA1_FULL_47_7]|nr:MAG: hypothetical protein A2204_07205 [Elusimicrobia bacterium RIFOXYA1_FULL_47_7]
MKKHIIFYAIAFHLTAILPASVSAAETPLLTGQPDNQNTAASEAVSPPVYLSELTNINDYGVFANGGWDGSWYAGYNLCWMEKLPKPPEGSYSKVYIGAKLGRMKTRPVAGKPVWEREPIPGEIYMAISSTPAWKSNQKYFLVSSADIPLEGDMENALEGVGESRWFWAEVPLSAVNFNGPNFVSLWSPTEYFVSTASAPVLAGGWGSQEVNTWMNNDIKGYPPINPATSLKTAITVFEPAIAVKLVPQGSEREIKVQITQVLEGRKKTSNKTFAAEITGSEIEKAWLEYSLDNKAWQKIGRYVYGTPYMFTLKADALPVGKVSVRCAAQDAWGNKGFSAEIALGVSKQEENKK